MTRLPVAYLRRSTADEGNPGDVSRAVQEHAIEELAHQDGFNGDVRYFVDWARSADEEKVEKRTDYARLLSEIEAGRVTDLYAYAMDRLHRSVVLTGKLMRACVEHHVRIVTGREGEVSESTPDKWLQVTIRATFSEYELRVMKVRAKANYDHRKARGDYMGVPPYGSRVVKGKLTDNPEEDEAVVLDAYQRAGSFLGAAKLLTAEGIPTRLGRAHWNEGTVAKIVRRYVSVPKLKQGVKQRGSWMFERLLRCPVDDQLLTPTNPKAATYFCGKGRRQRDHPRPYAVSERRVLAWAKVEAARLSIPIDAVSTVVDNDGRRAELTARRQRFALLFGEGAIDLERWHAERDRVDAELAHLDDAEAIVEIPAIDWTRGPAAVNAVLRTLWRFVELDEQMRPVRAEWTVPEWRA